MEFGIEKCAMLIMEKGKIVKSVGMELPDGKVIKLLQEGESYKYLGILEADKFLEENMKLNVSEEYIRRLRKDLKSKLNGGNLVRGVIKSLQEGESYKYLGILEADKFLEEKMKLNVSEEYIRRLRKDLKSKLNGGNLVRGVIKSLQEGESYKYLGILEADKFLEEKMKLNVSEEYIRRLRKDLKSKLNGGNLVRGVNTWAVSLIIYLAPFVSRRKSELQAIDRKTRKLFTMYGALHPKSDVDRLYIPRKEGGRGLISIEDCVELARRGLEVYVHGSEERLIQAARRDKMQVF